MIDHVGFKVSDFAASKAFYERVLAPLGYGLVMEVTPEMTGTDARHAGFGANGKPDFWISPGSVHQGSGVHVALQAKSRADVDAFHAGALAAGARDNGPPGIRAHYHPSYYGAFVLDPDGHNIEAVCHLPETQR
jgi:catechol 2,3-dioxygenase-like lactoylglutathione lyase family enzyme